jgi:hypothetical protein
MSLGVIKTIHYTLSTIYTYFKWPTVIVRLRCTFCALSAYQGTASASGRCCCSSGTTFYRKHRILQMRLLLRNAYFFTCLHTAWSSTLAQIFLCRRRHSGRKRPCHRRHYWRKYAFSWIPVVAECQEWSRCGFASDTRILSWPCAYRRSCNVARNRDTLDLHKAGSYGKYTTPVVLRYLILLEVTKI